MTGAITITCLIGALLLVSWFWRPKQPVELGTWILLIAYAAMGGWALWFSLYAMPGTEPTAFVLWKPTVLYWTLAIILFTSPLIGWGYPVQAIFGTYFAMSTKQWRWMNRGFVALFTLLGGVNLLVAFSLSEGNWEGFKYSCRVLLMFIILLRLNFVWLEIASKVVIYLWGRAKALFP